MQPRNWVAANRGICELDMAAEKTPRDDSPSVWYSVCKNVIELALEAFSSLSLLTSTSGRHLQMHDANLSITSSPTFLRPGETSVSTIRHFSNIWGVTKNDNDTTHSDWLIWCGSKSEDDLWLRVCLALETYREGYPGHYQLVIETGKENWNDFISCNKMIISMDTVIICLAAKCAYWQSPIFRGALIRARVRLFFGVRLSQISQIRFFIQILSKQTVHRVMKYINSRKINIFVIHHYLGVPYIEW